MNMSVSVANVRCLDEGVWKASLTPSEAYILGPSSNSYGPVSIVLLTESPIFDEPNSKLSFSPTTAQVLNLGTSDQTILISEVSPDEINDDSHVSGRVFSISTGDAHFLGELSEELKEFGTKILKSVREHFPGALKFHPKSGKYVETPDNFWTIRIQSRDRSFRFTVRGRPESFKKPRSLVLKPDMTGYSSFKVSNPAQISELLDVLQQVSRK